MVRFIHTSDWQLGMTRHYLNADAQPRFTGDRIETVRRILGLAVERECAFVVVAGDVFEHPNLGQRDIGRALQAMGAKPVPVYLLPGNHDPLGTGSVWATALVQDNLPPNVTLLDSVGPWPVAEGVEIVAAPWSTKQPDSDPVAGSLDGLTADGTVRILVGHGMLEGLEPDATSAVMVRRAPLEAAVAAGTVHYVALGDRHIRWPLDGHGAIHYSGTHESTGFRERGRGQVLEVDLTASTLRVDAHEVGQWQHAVVTRELNGSEDIDSLAADLDAFSPKERTIVKTALTGSLTLAERAALDRVIEDHEPLFASLEEWERHTDLVVLPGDLELTHLHAGGYVQESMQHLITLARSSPRVQDSPGDPTAHGTGADDDGPRVGPPSEATGNSPWHENVRPAAPGALDPAVTPDEEDQDGAPEPSSPPVHETAQDALRLLIRLSGGESR